MNVQVETERWLYKMALQGCLSLYTVCSVGRLKRLLIYLLCKVSWRPNAEMQCCINNVLSRKVSVFLT